MEDMFCWIPKVRHSSRMNRDVNRGSLLLIILSGSPYHRTMTSRKVCAVSSAVMVSLHGMKCVILVQPWSVMVSMESYPSDEGNLVIKSKATILNGVVFFWGYIGCSGALVGLLFTLCL